MTRIAKLTGSTAYQHGHIDGWMGSRFTPTKNIAYAIQYGHGYKDGKAAKDRLVRIMNASTQVQP